MNSPPNSTIGPDQNQTEKVAVLRGYSFVLGLQLAVCTAWAVSIPVDPVSDSVVFDQSARQLSEGHGYVISPGLPTAYWPVGTSFVHSCLYRIFGYSYAPGVVMNILLRLGTTFLTMRLAQQWFGRRVGILSGIALALWPSQTQFVTVIASEIPFMFLSMLAILIWTREQSSLWRRAILAGGVLAAASYVRPIALLLPVVFVLLRVHQTKEISRNLIAIILMFAVISSLIAPWSIRNSRAFGQFVLLSTNGGANFWMGNNPNTEGAYMPLPENTNGLNEAQRDRELKNRALEYLRRDPIAFVSRTFVKAVKLHDRETIGVHWNERGITFRWGKAALTPLKWWSQGFWLFALALAITGVFFLLKSSGVIKAMLHPCVLMWVYFGSVHAVIVIQDRYHFPSIPFIAILAGLAGSHIWGFRKTRASQQQGVAT